MKTAFVTLAALALATAAASKTIEITVADIRSDKGSILVMAKTAASETPVYGMTAAKKGSVTVTLAGIESATAEVSLFHDEDGDYQLKMGDRGPMEGYAARKCKLAQENNTIKLRLYYPAAEN